MSEQIPNPVEIQRRRRVVRDAVLLLYRKFGKVPPAELESRIDAVEADPAKLATLCKELTTKDLDPDEREILVQLQARARLAGLCEQERLKQSEPEDHAKNSDSIASSRGADPGLAAAILRLLRSDPGAVRAS